jgi:hypothetical protein
MKQVARNLTDVSDGFLLNSRHIIMDRDTKYTDAFRGHLDREGVKPVHGELPVTQRSRTAILFECTFSGRNLVSFPKIRTA